MLSALQARTYHPHQIFVVDNCSSQPGVHAELERMQKAFGFHLLLSKKNNWVLGFNLALEHPDWPEQAPFYVFSDSDIEVPAAVDGIDWLGHLVGQMDANACIGKLGLSLSTNNLPAGPLKARILARERQFDAFPSIGDNKICPVDTTLAIYRRDFFMGSRFRFSIGHATLARPYYYTCRTSRQREAVHLGWYPDASQQTSSLQSLEEKIRCFARYGAYVEPEVLASAPAAARVYYRLLHPLARLYWGMRVVWRLLCFYAGHFPRNVNELQNRCR